MEGLLGWQCASTQTGWWTWKAIGRQATPHTFLCGTGAPAAGLGNWLLSACSDVSVAAGWLWHSSIPRALPARLLQGHVLRRSSVSSQDVSHLRRSVREITEPYTFPSYHTRILEPYNYYEFGQKYVRTLINFETSVVSRVRHLMLCLLCGCVTAIMLELICLNIWHQHRCYTWRALIAIVMQGVE